MFPDEGREAFWRNPLVSVFAVEIISTVIFAVFQKRRLQPWLTKFFIVLHYIFWIFVLWPDVGISMHPLWAPKVLLFICPSSCIASLLYVRSMRSEPNNSLDRKRCWGCIVAGLAGFLVLAFIWFPPKNYSLVAARNLESVSIVMSRGPCMGVCPVYEVTILANGSVEYEGTRFVRAKGREVSAITRQQMLRILQNLDQVGFTGLEDRAFDWCFDSSSVAVQVSVDGKAKRVVSDAGCVGAKFSPQAQFVGAADNIDRIVNSNQWTLCNGSRCR